MPRAPRDPTGRQEGEPPTLTPFPRPKAAPDGAPDGNQGTDRGRRADMNAKETAICFLCGMAGALALVVAQRLLG